MPELEWIQSTATTWYCQHGRYFLKKKIYTGREQFEVWKGDRFKYVTGNYPDFLYQISHVYILHREYK